MFVVSDIDYTFFIPISVIWIPFSCSCFIEALLCVSVYSPMLTENSQKNLVGLFCLSEMCTFLDTSKYADTK